MRVEEKELMEIKAKIYGIVIMRENMLIRVREFIRVEARGYISLI